MRHCISFLLFTVVEVRGDESCYYQSYCPIYTFNCLIGDLTNHKDFNYLISELPIYLIALLVQIFSRVRYSGGV